MYKTPAFSWSFLCLGNGNTMAIVYFQLIDTLLVFISINASRLCILIINWEATNDD